MSLRKVVLLILCYLSISAYPQLQTRKSTLSSESGSVQSGNNHVSWGRDTTSTKKTPTPIGVHQWTVEDRLGNIVPAENNDTVVHNYQFWNNTEGQNGEYNILGNLGSPRLSRIYFHRDDFSEHIFVQPYSFFIGDLRDFRFSNTLSPLTNLSYHKVGNRTNGQERVRAYFASNINKNSGIGFKLDYLYGRGYYNSQANSQFGGTLFGYYLGDRYNLHAWINANHSKMGENGGIEDDAYITNPQSFPQSYSSKDIPTTLTETWNRNDNQTYFLTHRYNLGAYHDKQLPDSLQPKMPEDKELLKQLSDSLRNALALDSLKRDIVIDSLRTAWANSIVKPQEYIPVSSIIHTLKIDNLQHTYYAYDTPEGYYTNHYYGDLANVRDKTKSLIVRNTLGLSMLEGFNKWAAMGITLYATHEYRNYTLPEIGDTIYQKKYHEQDLIIGGEISRAQGSVIHYNVNGELYLAGRNAGDFNVNGKLDLSFPLGKKDSLSLNANGFVKSNTPGFYLRHFHSQFEWWDNDELSREFKTRIEGTLSFKRSRTSITVGVENVKNYTYFAMQNTLTGTDANSVLSADYSHSVGVRQHTGNVQVFTAMLKQDVKAGPLHWDNEISYQASSSQDVLPLPKLNIYTNLYLAFRIAKVLNVQLGADCRYFTSYYAPDYSPAIGQWATQDTSNPRIKIGNYPILNAYANLHIKHCRLYVAMQHFNAGTGNRFWAPHYAMDPRTIHLGVSWNFFN